MSEVTGIIQYIKEFGFSIAVAIYLLWERTKTFEDAQRRYQEMNNMLVDVVKANTIAFVELKATIEKLCNIVGDKK